MKCLRKYLTFAEEALKNLVVKGQNDFVLQSLEKHTSLFDLATL